MKPLQNPEQELRFTRAGQALSFWLLAAVLIAVAITLMASAYYREINPDLPHPLWALPPLILGWLSARLAFHMTRHAYLILTPLGVEIFPLLRPRKSMQVVYWQEIAELEVDEAQRRLTLHFDAAHSAGIHLSLGPIARPRRDLLIHAMQERVTRRK